MRVLSFFTVLFFTAFLAKAQEHSDKTLIKTLDPSEATSVVIDFKAAQINPQPWDGMGFRIELIIKSNMPLHVLEQLVKAGRYTLEGVKDGDTYFVNAPNLEKNVSVRGKDLEEEISVSVKTPGYYIMANNTLFKDATSLVARGLDETKILDYKKITDSIGITEVKIQSTLKGSPNIKLKTGDILIDGKPIIIQNK
jgi:hypothetical protein